MTTQHNTEKTTWWIAHNNDNVFHYGSCPEGQQISSGQPLFETFDNRNDWELRLQDILPSDKYIEFKEQQEEENELYENTPPQTIDDLGVDHKLYTDSVDHLLYENRGFRYTESPLKKP